MKKLLFLFSIISLSLASCIQDDVIEDFVEPTLRITTVPDTILEGTDFQFSITYLNNIGLPEEITPTWTSSAPEIISINSNGLATAISKGASTIQVSYTQGDINVSEEIIVNVGEVTTIVVEPSEKSGVIRTTTFYDLEGDFTITETDGKLIIDIADNYVASAGLPGLFLYLSNNPNSINNAFEVSAVEVFSGEHSYEVDGIGLDEYSHLLYFCKPFNVKVGDGEIQ